MHAGAALHRQAQALGPGCDAPAQHGAADEPRLRALGERRQLLLEAVASYTSALQLQASPPKASYASRLDAALRAHRGLSGTRGAPIMMARAAAAAADTAGPDTAAADTELPPPAAAVGRRPHGAEAAEVFIDRQTEAQAREEVERLKLEGADGSLGAAAMFGAGTGRGGGAHYSECGSLASGEAAVVRHACDIATSLRVWTRDPVQLAGRAVVHAGLAGALMLLGQRRNALAQWRVALKVFPPFVGARYNLASALLQQADEEKLARAREQGAGASGGAGAGGLSAEAEAIAHLQAVLRLEPMHPQANNAVANYLA
jgi:tetratricopeptide (TPR) repeat protein